MKDALALSGAFFTAAGVFIIGAAFGLYFGLGAIGQHPITLDQFVDGLEVGTPVTVVGALLWLGSCLIR